MQYLVLVAITTAYLEHPVNDSFTLSLKIAKYLVFLISLARSYLVQVVCTVYGTEYCRL